MHSHEPLEYKKHCHVSAEFIRTTFSGMRLYADITWLHFCHNTSARAFQEHQDRRPLATSAQHMSHPIIDVAVVGTGLIGPRHAHSIVKSEQARLCCFVDPASHAQAVADEFKVQLFRSIEEMLEKGMRPDAALVCTPNRTHVALSEQLLRSNIHVLVEKPISTTIADGRKLIQTAASLSSQLLVGHHRRFNPYITATKRALEEGVVGRPIALSGIWALCKPQSYFEQPTEWRTKADGGGPILINMIHEVDILQYLFGSISRVHAEKTLSQRDYEAEEGAAILLRFASGLVGTFVLSDSTPSPHSFESGTGENPIIPQTGCDFYRIFGTEGTLSVGDMKLHRYPLGVEKGWSNHLEEISVTVGEEVPFDKQIEHFVRVVRGLEAPRCSGLDGLRALVVCDAIKQALQKTDGVVDIQMDSNS